MFYEAQSLKYRIALPDNSLMQSRGRGRDDLRRIDNGADAVGRDARPPRILRIFTVFTVIGFIVAVAATALIVRNDVERNSEDKLAQYARFVGNAVLASHLEKSQWNDPLSREETLGLSLDLRELLEREAISMGAIGLNVFNTDGEVIFASQGQESAGFSSDARNAANGASNAFISTETVDGSERRVVNGFAPVFYPGDERPVGSIQIRADHEVVAESVGSRTWPITAILLLVMVGLFVGLWPMLRRTTKQLSASNRELRRRAAELSENLRQRSRIEDRLRDTILDLERSENALEHSQEETIMRLSLAVESRDAETGSHIERMGKYCHLIASKLGWSDDRCELLRVASPLHDVGKIAIPDEILRKPGALTDEERKEIERHAEIGHKILAGSDSRLLDLAARVALTHHEHWDGNGYPNGLAGEKIPIEGRIAAIADVFDALTSDRVYRPAMTVERTLSIMTEGRGTQFDPELIDLFIDSIEEVLQIRDGRDLLPADDEPRTATKPRKQPAPKNAPPAQFVTDAPFDQHDSMVG